MLITGIVMVVSIVTLYLKALCHDIRRNCQLKWIQEVYYYSIVYGSSRRLTMCSAKNLSKSSGEARNLQRYGQPKSKNTDK